jgi:hypothetical protein
MAHVSFTRNIQRHVNCPPLEAGGKTVSEVLAKVFQQNPQAESYVVDERGSLRKHMVIFVDGDKVMDRETLSDEVKPESEIHIFQALSGGVNA